MKYRSGKSLPGSVAVWLEQQLEDRGIDSAIYSRYILSLLQDDSPDPLTHIPTKKKGNKRGRSNNWTNSSEVLKRCAVVECLNGACDESAGIEALVDELCMRLNAVNSEGNKSCLKEKTNSSDICNFKATSPTSSSKYYAAFPALSKESAAINQFTFQSSAWTKNISLAFKKKEIEGSPKENKVSKRRDSNKENIFTRGRMRSRSMVKQQQGGAQRGRNTAKSLDRKDDAPTPNRFSKGKQQYHFDIKNRKCLNFCTYDEPQLSAKKISRTPGHQDKLDDPLEYDKFLPMDFQQLLQSPQSPEDSFLKPCQNKQVSDFRNFIQCGTNIISSIWSEKCERMEDEAFPEELNTPWEIKQEQAMQVEAKNNIPWSSAHESLLSSWRKPFDFGLVFNNNNNNNKLNYWSDVESTSLSLKNDGCFFSCIGNQKSDVALKHNQQSSFTEVTPKHKVGLRSPKKKPTLYTYKQTISDQEEDLLTSTKTHFKPIKQHECSDSIVPPSSQYADGTCFSVSSSLEKINFHRSESGALYIGPDQKYMEFKYSSSPVISPQFVPKFKVNLNEKFCQTEDSLKELDQDKCNEFYFPEDEQLAEDMVNSLVDDDEPPPTIKVEGFLTTWPLQGSLQSDIWSNTATYDKKSWVTWNNNNNNINVQPAVENERYIRLRNELSEDGDELLSDLSSIHLFIESDHITDSATKAHYPKRMRFRPCTFQTRNMANESLA